MSGFCHHRNTTRRRCVRLFGRADSKIISGQVSQAYKVGHALLLPPQHVGFVLYRTIFSRMLGSTSYTIYLRFAGRRSGHEVLHSQCYSGARRHPRNRLSIIVKVSPCVSTNWLGVRHLTGWWLGRRGVFCSGTKWPSDVPYKARCWLQFAVDDGDVQM
jgi:hypothetical protein